MTDKFTYFDFVAHIVPGALFLEVMSSVLGTVSFILVTGNPAIDTLLFLIVSFTIGGLLHQLGKYTVEPLVQHLFWRGKRYSEIYLVKKYGLCPDIKLKQVIETATTIFGFEPSSLSCLEMQDDKTKYPDPHTVSHQVFRRFDYYTSDNNLAKKGHLANTFYSFYRTITLTLFIFAIAFASSYYSDTSSPWAKAKIVLAIFCFFASFMFLLRTRSEGQRYVEGVLSPVDK